MSRQFDDRLRAHAMNTLSPRLLLSTLLVAQLVLVACSGNEPATEDVESGAAATSPQGPAGSSTIGYGATPNIRAYPASAIEGDSGETIVSVRVTLSPRAAGDVFVDYMTVNASAKDNADYRHAKGRVVFKPGVTEQTIEIAIMGDAIDEIDETFRVLLAGPIGANLAVDSVLGTIIDDDASPILTVGDTASVEGNSGITNFLFPVTLNAPSEKIVSVDYSTLDGDAVVPSDFTAISGVVTFSAGETAKSIVVAVNGDVDTEADESFVLSLQNPVNVVLGAISAEGLIVDDDGPISGLNQRPQNLTCVAPDEPTVTAAIDDQRVFNALPDAPQALALVQSPGDSSQWYRVIRNGVIYRFDNVPAPSGQSVFLDHSSVVDSSFGEGGLLGIAFHPDYANNNFVFLSYTATGPDASYPLTSRLSRFTSVDGGLTLDPGSEAVLISLDQPEGFHNGGHIVFGPDGFLYMGLGDGGGDPIIGGVRSQNTKNLFGSVLRIDVDSGTPYAIPAENPFAQNELCDISLAATDAADNCPEIFAWGLRNPWRFSFDSATGDLWLGDVGQNAYEEVNLIEVGGNYGWNIQEGEACFNPSTGCDKSGLVQPLLTYDHSVGVSVTGGFVYRGSAIPELFGRYLFVDFGTNVIFATVTDIDGNYDYEMLGTTVSNVSSLSEDENNEIIGTRYSNGRLLKFVQSGGSGVNTIPDLLSQSGCVDSIDPTLPAAGLIPYTVNAALWSDGAVKDRYYALPEAATVDVAADGDWMFPNGTVLMKQFKLDGALIETRLYMRHTNGVWGGYSYEWNASETEATRVVGGKTKLINGQDWVYPSEVQCRRCHTDAASFSIGIEHAQLNSDFTYPSSAVTANQLQTANEIGVLTAPLPGLPHTLPELTDPTDLSASLEDRARAYMHANCSGCHRPLGPTPTDLDLRFETDLALTNTCDVAPTSGDLGLSSPKIIAPGDSANSVLLSRMARRDVFAMPPLGTNLVDGWAVSLVAAWIDSMAECP